MATMLVGRRDDEFVPAERRGLRGARRVPGQDGGGGAFYNCILFWHFTTVQLCFRCGNSPVIGTIYQ